MSKERVPNHDHSGFNEGGKLALSKILSTDEAGAVSGSSGGGGSSTTDPGSVLVSDEGSILATAASVLDFVGGGVVASGTGTTKTITVASPSSSLRLFLPEDYGAVGDGSTDDTTALNACHAAANAAGHGTIFYSSSAYLASGAMTAITAPIRLVGNGMSGAADGTTITGTKLICSSGSANFLTIGSGCTVRDLALVNTAGSVTAGYGLGTSASAIGFHIGRVSSTGFWIDFDLDGGLWSMTGCYARQAHKYGIDVSYAAVPDGGDTTISDTVVVEGANSSDAGIHISSGGGLKIVNCKTLGNASGMAHGIWLDVANAVTASVLLISNCSIEDTRGDNILLQTTGSGVWRGINVTDCEFHNGVVTNAYALELSGGAANGIKDVFLDGINAHLQSAGSVTALRLTNTTNVWIGPVISDGYTGKWTDNGGNSGYVDDTGSVANVNITGTPSTGYVPTATSATAATWQAAPGGGVTGFATPAIVLGTAAATGAATTVIRSDATIIAFDATAPTTSAIGDAAATGSAAFGAHRDHVHGREALSTATPLVESGAGAVGTGTKNSREDHVHPASSASAGVGTYGLLVEDGVTAPPVTLYTEDGTDWIYADG